MQIKEVRAVESHTSLTSTDWVLSLFVTAVVVGWQLSVSSGFTATVAGILTFGGLALGVSIQMFEWYRER
jgi:hypothetical protein